jgi:hypothetical protein
MSAALAIYFASVSDLVSKSSSFVIGFSFLFFIVFSMLRFACQDESFNVSQEFKNKINFFIKTSISVVVMSGIVHCIFPTEKTIYMMMGAHYIGKSDVPAKIESAIVKKLDEYLKEDGK